MSQFSNLSQLSQDIIMLQFEFFGKIFLIGFFFTFACIYAFYWRKKQEDTPYMLVSLIRTILYFLSLIYIYSTPLFIIWIYPQIAIDTILIYTFWFYGYVYLVLGLLFFINIMFYGPMVLAKLGGLNIQSKNASKIMDDFLGKYKKLWRGK